MAWLTQAGLVGYVAALPATWEAWLGSLLSTGLISLPHVSVLEVMGPDYRKRAPVLPLGC